MPSADFSRQTLFRPNPFSLGHRLLILKLLGISSARSLGVRHTSFTAQPPDLPSWRYVCLLGFGLLCNLTRHLALYQVSVRRLNRFATPLPSPQPHGFRLAVRYTWRQIPVVGLSPTRCAPCPTHKKSTPTFVSVLESSHGRGSRSRTHINGFGDRCSTIELYP